METEKKKVGRPKLPDDVRLARRRENFSKWMETHREQHNANVMRTKYSKKYGKAKADQLMALYVVRKALKAQC